MNKCRNNTKKDHIFIDESVSNMTAINLEFWLKVFLFFVFVIVANYEFCPSVIQYSMTWNFVKVF